MYPIQHLARILASYNVKCYPSFRTGLSSLTSSTECLACHNPFSGIFIQGRREVVATVVIRKDIRGVVLHKERTDNLVRNIFFFDV